MFIAGKRLLPVPLGWMNKRIQVLHRRSGGSIDREHNIVFLTKKETYIRRLELEATASRAINGSLEVRVGGKADDIGTLIPIHDRV